MEMEIQIDNVPAGLLRDFIDMHRDEFEEFCRDKADGGGAKEITAIYAALDLLPDNE